MKYIQNNTDRPLSLMIMEDRTEPRVVQAVLDSESGKLDKVQKDVTYSKWVGDYYFPEEINGDFFPVSLTDAEYKALEARKDFQVLRQGTRPVLSVVDIPADSAKKLDSFARARDIKGLYSNDQALIDAHLALLGG